MTATQLSSDSVRTRDVPARGGRRTLGSRYQNLILGVVGLAVVLAA